MCSRALMNWTFLPREPFEEFRVVAAVTGNARELVRDDNGEFTSVHATQHLPGSEGGRCSCQTC